MKITEYEAYLLDKQAEADKGSQQFLNAMLELRQAVLRVSRAAPGITVSIVGDTEAWFKLSCIASEKSRGSLLLDSGAMEFKIFGVTVKAVNAPKFKVLPKHPLLRPKVKVYRKSNRPGWMAT